jgi:hypothetical protein
MSAPDEELEMDEHAYDDDRIGGYNDPFVGWTQDMRST